MGIVSQLLSLAGGAKSSKKDDIAAIEAPIRRLQADRKAAEDKLDGAAARRRELLLADAADESIAELDRELAAAQLTLERLKLAEPSFSKGSVPPATRAGGQSGVSFIGAAMRHL